MPALTRLSLETATFLLGILLLVIIPAHADSIIASDYFSNMRRLDPTTGAILQTFTGGASSGELAFGPDGAIYATHFESLSIERINSTTGQTIHTIPLPGKPRDITFRPDGQLYVAITSNGGHAPGVYLLDPITKQVSTRFNTSDLNGSPIGFAPGLANDLYIAVDGRSGNGTSSIVRIDATTGNTLSTFTSHINIPQSLAFGPNGHLYVGNQGDSDITEYTAAGTYLGTLTSTAGNPQGLTFLSNGDLIWGTGGTTFADYNFTLNSQTVFSSGFNFAFDTVRVREPATFAAIALVPLLLCRKRRA